MRLMKSLLWVVQLKMKFQKNSLVKPPENVTMVNIMNPKEFENKDNEDYIEFSLVVEEVQETL